MGINRKNPKYIRSIYESPLIKMKKQRKDYLMSLCVPSVSSSFSLCAEYIRKWIKNKFQPDFFKSETINGSNILYNFMTEPTINNIIRNKPALAITPKIDFSWNRENTDLYLYGRNIYVNRNQFDDCFFINPINKNMLSLELEQMKIDVAFRIKVSSFNTGVDLFKFMQLAFRSNATETRYADLDFQVPRALMLAIASDCGFEIQNGLVVKNCEFLAFLNKYSRLPFVCKFRGTKGEFEYFIKITHMYIHLRTGDIDLDDGEREGQTDNNFIVSAQTECLFPVPKFYAYYAKDKHNFAVEDKSLQCTIYNLFLGPVPFKNEKGWNQYMTTDYVEDDEIVNSKDKLTTINFGPAIKSTMENALFNISEYTKSIFISPAAFIDIKLFNGVSEQDIDIEWNTYTITTKHHLTEKISQIVFYVDLEFINNYAINTQKGYSTRIDDTNKYL